MTSQPLAEPTTRSGLLAQIEQEYDDFIALIQAKPANELMTELDDGRSSREDMVAHLADWEAYALSRLRNHTSGNVVPARIVRDEDLDRVNAEIQERARGMSWEHSWTWLQETHAEMMTQLSNMREDDIFDTARNAFSVEDPGTNVLHLIFSNTSEHYREHADELRNSLESSSDADLETVLHLTLVPSPTGEGRTAGFNLTSH